MIKWLKKRPNLTTTTQVKSCTQNKLRFLAFHLSTIFKTFCGLEIQNNQKTKIEKIRYLES